jgi:DnaK suppressor protein
MKLNTRLPIEERKGTIGEPVVSSRDLDRYRKLLLAKRDDLSAALVPPAGGAEGDLMDRASADTQAELEIQLHQNDRRLLKAIEDALARIRAGTFGVCETCKQPISRARLEAVPWTRHCRECKERSQAA